MSKVVSDVPDEEEIRQMFSDYGSIVKHPTFDEMNEYLQSIKETKEKQRKMALKMLIIRKFHFKK